MIWFKICNRGRFFCCHIRWEDWFFYKKLNRDGDDKLEGYTLGGHLFNSKYGTEGGTPDVSSDGEVSGKCGGSSLGDAIATGSVTVRGSSG